MSELNIKLLRNVVIWAMGEEELISKKYEKLKKFSWYQGDWARKERNGVCETAYCIAGAAAVMSGYKINWAGWEEDDYSMLHSQEKVLHANTAVYCRRGVATFAIDDAAIMELGITNSEANRLFDGDNSIETVIRIADDIAASHGYTLFKKKHLKKMSKNRQQLVKDSI